MILGCIVQNLAALVELTHVLRTLLLGVRILG